MKQAIFGCCNDFQTEIEKMFVWFIRTFLKLSGNFPGSQLPGKHCFELGKSLSCISGAISGAFPGLQRCSSECGLLHDCYDKSNQSAAPCVVVQSTTDLREDTIRAIRLFE